MWSKIWKLLSRTLFKIKSFNVRIWHLLLLIAVLGNVSEGIEKGSVKRKLSTIEGTWRTETLREGRYLMYYFVRVNPDNPEKVWVDAVTYIPSMNDIDVTEEVCSLVSYEKNGGQIDLSIYSPEYSGTYAISTYEGTGTMTLTHKGSGKKYELTKKCNDWGNNEDVCNPFSYNTNNFLRLN